MNILAKFFRNKYIIRNKCGHSNCWNYDCDEWCDHYKPRLFGFIPVGRKFGGWLEYIQEKLFFKFCVNTEDPHIDDFIDEDWGTEEYNYE